MLTYAAHPPAGELDSLGFPKEDYEIGDLVGAISISTPMSEYYQTPWNSVAKWLLLLLAGLVVAGVAVFAVLNRTVLRPVSAMSQAVHAYREGSFDYRLGEPRGNDEVANLARSSTPLFAQAFGAVYSCGSCGSFGGRPFWR